MPIRKAWVEAAARPERLQYVLAGERDDESVIRQLAELQSDEAVIVLDPDANWSTSVRNWNTAAQRADGALMVVIADDLSPPAQWDLELDAIVGAWDPTEVAFAIKVSDSEVPGDLLMRHPIISRRYFERHGLFSAQYHGLFADNDFTLRAFWHGLVLDGRSLRWEHRHPQLGFGSFPSHDRQGRDAEYDYGHARFTLSWHRILRLAPVYSLKPGQSPRKAAAVAVLLRARALGVGVGRLFRGVVGKWLHTLSNALLAGREKNMERR